MNADPQSGCPALFSVVTEVFQRESEKGDRNSEYFPQMLDPE